MQLGSSFWRVYSLDCSYLCPKVGQGCLCPSVLAGRVMSQSLCPQLSLSLSPVSLCCTQGGRAPSEPPWGMNHSPWVSCSACSEPLPEPTCTVHPKRGVKGRADGAGWHMAVLCVCDMNQGGQNVKGGSHVFGKHSLGKHLLASPDVRHSPTAAANQGSVLSDCAFPVGSGSRISWGIFSIKLLL